MKHKKWYTLAICILILLIILINIFWGIMFLKERDKVKHSIIPTLSEDYFLERQTLTKNAKNYIAEIDARSDYKENYTNSNFQIEDVPLISQNPDYPNGCEAASAVMLLNYYGINITLQEFIENHLLTKNVYEENGTRFGPNPALYYAGNPASTTRGWGCFEPVIVRAMKSAIASYEKKTNQQINIEVLETEAIHSLETYTLFNEPFLIWTTIDYEEESDVYEWFSYDLKNTYTYPKNSHTVVVTGMDELYYYINDPLKKEKKIPVKRETLEKSFDSLGRQKILLKKN